MASYKLIYICLIMFYLIFSCQKKNIKSQKQLDTYNERIIKGENKNETWVKSPLMIAVKLVAAGEVSELTKIELKRLDESGELTKNVEIRIKEKTYLGHDFDDPNVSFYFHLKKTDGKWRVVN